MKNSPRPSLFTSTLFLSLFLVLVLSVTSDVIRDSCDKAAKGDANINFDFCVSSLEENPKSKTANTTENLVSIAVEIAITNATGVSSIVSELLENNNFDKYTKGCLEDCSALYSDAASDLQSGGQAVQSKDYGTANAVISAVMDAPETCEDGFKEKKGLVSPLTKKNNDFFQLTAILLAFINMLQ